MIKTLAIALTLSTLLAAPAMAAAACSGTYALSKDFNTEDEINDYNLGVLKSIGVKAERVEMWGGCIRAFVRQDDGREEMQFFEPSNFQRVQ